MLGLFSPKVSIFLILLLVLCTPGRCLYSKDSPVLSLGTNDFEQRVKGGLWVVEFYAPWCGHCKNLKPAYESVGQGLQGIIGVAAVDCDTNKELAARFQVTGFPTIKLFYTDSKAKLKSLDYSGGRTAPEIIKWALASAQTYALKKIGQKASSKEDTQQSAGQSDFYGKDSSVVNLSSKNFANVENSDKIWLVEFYAPWCGHCKNLKSAWEEAAKKLKGKVNVGAVDCTADESLCGRFEVKGFPTLIYFGESKKRPEPYNGPRDSDSIVQFALDKWSVNAPIPELKQLTDKKIFESECESEGDSVDNKICFFAFLPDVYDSKASGRNKYIEILKQLAFDYRDRPYAFLWAEGGQQTALEKCFGVGGYGYPAFIAYTPDKKIFASMKASLVYSHVKDFIQALRQGHEKLFPIEGGISEIASTPVWDGKDVKEDTVDEFNLDEIMNEEL